MNIYFSGISGVGIGPLAQIAHDIGHSVCGSDTQPSQISQSLSEAGVAIRYDQSGDFLRSLHEKMPIDRFIYTSAMPQSHPELVTARALHIPIAKRDALLNELLASTTLKLVAVAGTHGKTTTTGMMIWAMQQLGVPVSYSIGTTISYGNSGHYEPDSEYFVYECDEFDRNFLNFHPHASLVPSIDYDHADTYPSIEDYKAAFRQFINQSSHTVLWQHDAEYLGAMPQNTWVLGADEVMPISLAGAHYKANATLVAKTLEYLGISTQEEIVRILSDFPGTDRRFERLADNLYSDYGHHPVEIKATLAMAQELNPNVVLVYQPHQNVRQHTLRNQYTDCMTGAAHIYWLPTYLSREDPILPILTPEELSSQLINKSDVTISDLDDELWQRITEARNAGSLVLCMGAGSIDNWVRGNLIR